MVKTVTDCTSLVIECAATLDPELFRHGDLHGLDVVAVPERLEERVREAKEQHVVHGPPAETVIDPEDRGLVERSQQNLVQLPCRFEIDTEWLLDDDSGTVSVQLRRRAGWRP
jgi:hypothetical protein